MPDTRNHIFSPVLVKNNVVYRRLYLMHESIEEQIDTLITQPVISTERVAKLKRQRLKVLDQLETIANQHRTLLLPKQRVEQNEQREKF